MLVVVNFSFADSLGNRLPTYIKLNTLDIDGNVDYKGYALTNVSRIYGNSAPVLFGNQDTSHAVTGSGSIVVDIFEANNKAYFDNKVYFVNSAITIDSNALELQDNTENRFGNGDDFSEGFDSSESKYRLVTGGDCTVDANVAIEVDTSKNVTIKQNLTVDGEIIGGAKSYAEMYRCCYNTASTIDTADVWHMVSTTTVGLLNNWTHEVGDTAAITAYADGGGGLVTVTSAGHGMSAGNMISITGSTNYNALEEVVGVHTNTFTVTATWAGDDGAGTWIKGDSLTAVANSVGVYAVNFTATLTPSVNNEIFSFAFSKNATECEKCRVRSKMGIVGDYKPAPGTALVTIAEGDVLNFIIKNIGANGNVTIRHGNINLHRL